MQQLLEEMTLEQKVGQLFLVRPDSLDLSQTQDQINDAKADGVTKLTDAMRQTLAEYPVGGVVIFGKKSGKPAADHPIPGRFAAGERYAALYCH